MCKKHEVLKTGCASLRYKQITDRRKREETKNLRRTSLGKEKGKERRGGGGGLGDSQMFDQ